MGEHFKPEPEYPQPRRPIDSPVPVHNFHSLPVEEITGKVFDSVVGYLDVVDEENMVASDPVWMAASRKLNQVGWELSILPDEDPERGALVSEALIGDGDEIARNMGVRMLPALFNRDFDAAMRITQTAIVRATRYGYSSFDPILDTLSTELGNATEEGRIESAVVPKVMSGLIHAWAKSAHEVTAVKRDREDAEDQRDIALAKVAAAKAGVKIMGGENIIAHNTGAIVFESPENKPKNT